MFVRMPACIEPEHAYMLSTWLYLLQIQHTSCTAAARLESAHHTAGKGRAGRAASDQSHDDDAAAGCPAGDACPSVCLPQSTKLVWLAVLLCT